MNTLEQNTTAGFSGQTPFAWWADHVTQVYRLAASVPFLPGLEIMRHLHRFFADAATVEVPKAILEKVRNRVSPKPPSDLDELKQAWQAVEETKGDWSKGR